MTSLEQCYTAGTQEALSSLGMRKEALSPEEKAKMLAAYRARPKGLAATQSAPAAAPAAGGMALDRSGYQGGYGTGGAVPGASLNARGQISGLPGKMAAFFL